MNPNISPRQFGNLTIKHHDTQYRTVVAETAKGRMVGRLAWDKQGTLTPNNPTISGVDVHKNRRGKGLATAMLQHALQHAPDLKHSHALTEDGKRFAARNPL